MAARARARQRAEAVQEREAARAAARAAAIAAARRPGAALTPDEEVNQLAVDDDFEENYQRLRDAGALLGRDDEDAHVPWAAAAHRACAVRELCEDDPRAPTPPGFRGELYLPQQTMLAAAVALARDPRLQLRNGFVVETAGARIAAQFSFGKTVLMLAVECALRAGGGAGDGAGGAGDGAGGGAPRAPTIGLLSPMIGSACPSSAAAPSDSYFIPTATLLCDAPLPFTVVAAAANVISQWEANAAQFTHLRTFTVENVHTLRAFAARFRANRAADVDLLFVKAGRVTATFVVAGEAAPPPARGRSMFEALARVLDGELVARLVIDDYDTLKLGGDDCFLPAAFTWLVSATRRTTQARTGPVSGGPPAADFLAANAPDRLPVLSAALDDVLNGSCTLRCAAHYVADHINSLQVAFRRVVVRGGRAGDILRDLDLGADIVEMVHADAVGTAAAALGIAAASVGDIVQRVVGAHLGHLRAAARTRARIARVRAGNLAAAVPALVLALAAVPAPAAGVSASAGTGTPPAGTPAAPPAAAPPAPPAGAPPAPTQALDPRTLGGLKKALRDGTEEEFVACWTANLASAATCDTALAELETAAAEVTEKYGKTLSRMRDNIREGYCQVCTVPFASSDSSAPAEESEAAYVLAGCCQIIVCENCVTKSVGGAGLRRFIDRCPNCAVDVRPTGLIRVGAELDLEAALGDDALATEPAAPAAAGGATAEEAAPPAGAALAAAPPAEIANAKLRALVQFLKQEPLECLSDEAVPPFIHGLLAGARSAPLPAAAPRRVLVFAMHPETTRQIEFAFGVSGIAYGVLRGGRAQKDAAVEALRAAPAGGVLLVTAAKDCAGIHMPWLTHIVFYHRVADRHIEAQVAARGQRLGRTHDLSVVLIANEGEVRGAH